MKVIKRYAALLSLSLLLTSCTSTNNSNQVTRNINTPGSSASPEAKATPDSKPSITIETLDDFERSEFYRTYKLYKEKGWPLRGGSYNTVYDAPSIHDVAIEVQTLDTKVIGCGLVFYEREALGDVELNFIYSLLQSLDTKVKLDSKVKEYIKTYTEKIRVFQIKEVTPITFGKFRIYAGKVGPEQTISIVKI